jgi:hypothetical protein
MSINTWLAQHYPVPAIVVPKNEALAHSINKWHGLLDEQLKAHDLKINKVGRLQDNKGYMGLSIGGSNCALCVNYSLKDEDPDESTGPVCTGCPIYESRGQVSCDTRTSYEHKTGEYSPWHCFAMTEDPKPMVAALELAQVYVDGLKVEGAPA